MSTRTWALQPPRHDEAFRITSPNSPPPSLVDEDRVPLPQSRRSYRGWSLGQVLRGSLSTALWICGFTLAWVMLDSFLPIPYTSLMALRAYESTTEGRPIRFNKVWVPLESISPYLQAAVLAGEDTRFFEHRGFDFEAIERAIRHNTKLQFQAAEADDSFVAGGPGLTRARKAPLLGGSTISQQTAKNVFLWPARSWVRKGVEVYFTSLIELLWPKQRILEVYLNVVEWGDGIYGAEAASQFYFHKSARQLSVAEAARLASVLPNPRRFQVNHPSGFVRFRQGTIQARMPMTYSYLLQAQRR